jgi:hypothetical protein
VPADPRVPLVELAEAVVRMLAKPEQRQELLSAAEVDDLIQSVIAVNEPAPTASGEVQAVVTWALRTRAQARILDLVIAQKMTIGAWFRPHPDEADTFTAEFRVGGRPMSFDEAASILCEFEQRKLADEGPDSVHLRPGGARIPAWRFPPDDRVGEDRPRVGRPREGQSSRFGAMNHRLTPSNHRALVAARFRAFGIFITRQGAFMRQLEHARTRLGKNCALGTFARPYDLDEPLAQRALSWAIAIWHAPRPRGFYDIFTTIETREQRAFSVVGPEAATERPLLNLGGMQVLPGRFDFASADDATGVCLMIRCRMCDLELPCVISGDLVIVPNHDDGAGDDCLNGNTRAELERTWLAYESGPRALRQQMDPWHLGVLAGRFMQRYPHFVDTAARRAHWTRLSRAVTVPGACDRCAGMHPTEQCPQEEPRGD